MSLKAVLTVGWRDDVAAPDSALRLFEKASKAEKTLDVGLKETLERERPSTVQGLDRLFRLRVGGFGKVKSMMAALTDYAADASSNVICRVDAFSYAFLRAAKNFDLLLPEESSSTSAGPFRRALPGWTRHIEGLRQFERVGAEIPAEDKKAYLALRRVVVRASARDEQRALALLLVSGPSTIKEISQDLGLFYDLGARVFGALRDAGVLTRDGDVFTIAEDALPTVLFCVNATMGLDYLKILGPDR